MLKVLPIAFLLMLSASVYATSAERHDQSDVDYTKPESVSSAFIAALVNKQYEIVPSLVMLKWRDRFTPKALERAFSEHTLPENLVYKVSYKNSGKRALVAIVGTQIGLELRLIEGKWLLEH